MKDSCICKSKNFILCYSRFRLHALFTTSRFFMYIYSFYFCVISYFLLFTYWHLLLSVTIKSCTAPMCHFSSLPFEHSEWKTRKSHDTELNWESPLHPCFSILLIFPTDLSAIPLYYVPFATISREVLLIVFFLRSNNLSCLRAEMGPA